MAWILEFISAMLQNAIPPADANARVQFTYRLRLTFVACSAFLGLIIFITCSMGWAPQVFPGFARADELHQNMQESLKHWAYEAEDAIMSMRVQQCKMAAGDAKDVYMATIQKRMQEYENLTRQQYQLPSCADL